MLVYNKADLVIISLQINLFSPWHSWKNDELALRNNHWLKSTYGIETKLAQTSSFLLLLWWQLTIKHGDHTNYCLGNISIIFFLGKCWTNYTKYGLDDGWLTPISVVLVVLGGDVDIFVMKSVSLLSYKHFGHTLIIYTSYHSNISDIKQSLDFLFRLPTFVKWSRFTIFRLFLDL